MLRFFLGPLALALAGILASCDVTGPEHEWRLLILDRNVDMSIGERRTLRAELRRLDQVRTDGVVWASMDPDIVQVEQESVLRAVGPGTARISAITREASASTTVNVLAGSISILLVEPRQAEFTWLSDSTRIEVRAWNENGQPIPPPNLSLGSTDPGVATVTPDGWVHSTGPGTAWITARSDGLSDSIQVRVNQEVDSLDLGDVIQIPRLDTVEIGLTAFDRTGHPISDPNVQWEVADAAIAAVDADARTITGLKLGSTTLTAIAGEQRASARVDVVEARIARVEINPTSASIDIGSTVQLAATLFDLGGSILSGRQVSWSSSDTRVATVSGSGLVAGIAAGSALISAASEGTTATITVTVDPNDIPARPTLLLDSVTPTAAKLATSGYSDPEGNPHSATDWEIDEAGADWTTLVAFLRETSTSLTAWEATGLLPETGYQARVRFRDSLGGWSEWSVPLRFDTPAEAASPSRPTLTVTGVDSTTVTLTGSAYQDPNDDDHAFTEWQLATDGTFSSPVATHLSSSDLTSWSRGGLNTSTTYYARARYKDDTGAFSDWSPTVTFKTLVGNRPPNSPTLSAGSIGPTSVTLSGSSFTDPDAGASHSASEWQIDESGGGWSSLAATSGPTATSLISWTTSGLTASTTYMARVRYRDNTLAWSEWSDSVVFKTSPPPNRAPNTPSLSAGSITSSTVTLSGSAFSDPDATSKHAASEWQIDENGGGWTSPAATSGVSGTFLTSWTASGLTPSTSYMARVRYKDDDLAWSDWSTAVTFTTSPPPNKMPATPTLSLGAASTSTITANGSSFSDPDAGDTHSATEWQVDEAGGDWSSPAASSGTSTSYLTHWTGTGLSPSTNYKIRVRYRDNRSGWSDWSSAGSFTTGGASLLFASNWGNSVGASSAATRDGSIWDRSFCTNANSVVDVVAGNSVGWSATTNVLRTRDLTRNDCYQVAKDLGNLSEGEDWYLRLYIRNDAESTVNQIITNHPVPMWVSGNIQAVFWSNWGTGVSGRYRAKMAWDYTSTNGGDFGTGDLHWDIVLDTGTWYRFEWRVEFVSIDVENPSVTTDGEAQVRIWPRVYDMGGSLLYDADDYRRTPGWGGSTTETLAEWYAAGNLIRLDALENTRQIGVGTEGPDAAGNTGNAWYYGSLMVTKGAWPGP